MNLNIIQYLVKCLKYRYAIRELIISIENGHIWCFNPDKTGIELDINYSYKESERVF